MGGGAQWMATAALALALAAPAQGYLYHYHERFANGSASFLFTEGQMFETHRAPFGNGPSFINVSLTVSIKEPLSRDMSASMWLVFMDSTNSHLVGAPEPGLRNFGLDVASLALCCTPFLPSQCGDAVEGEVIHRRAPNGTREPLVVGVPLVAYPEGTRALEVSGGAGGEVALRGGRGLEASRPTLGTAVAHGYWEVEVAGWQQVLVVPCSPAGVLATDMEIDIHATFKNPYGYLPGVKYGFLPFYSALFILYSITLVVYGVMLYRNRQHLVLLQYLTTGLMLLGLVEVAIWTFMYSAHNKSGQAPCCPVINDVVAAVVFNVVKRAATRGLLFAVCLGFGVTQQALPRRTTLYIVVLCFLYFLFAAINDIHAVSDYVIRRSFWELPVTMMDAIFAVSIFGALGNIRQDLQQAGQVAKRKMYDQLVRVLQVFIGVWLIFTVLTLLVNAGVMPFPWKSLWAFENFWDVLYLATLWAVAYLWAPGETTAQYSAYQQSALDDDGVDSAAGSGPDTGLELPERQAGASHFVIEDDDDDDEADGDDVDVVLGSPSPNRHTAVADDAPLRGADDDQDAEAALGQLEAPPAGEGEAPRQAGGAMLS